MRILIKPKQFTVSLLPDIRPHLQPSGSSALKFKPKMKTIVQIRNELKAEVKRLTALLEANGIDPTGKSAKQQEPVAKQVSDALSTSLKKDRAIIKKIQ